MKTPHFLMISLYAATAGQKRLSLLVDFGQVTVTPWICTLLIAIKTLFIAKILLNKHGFNSFHIPFGSLTYRGDRQGVGKYYEFHPFSITINKF